MKGPQYTYYSYYEPLKYKENCRWLRFDRWGQTASYFDKSGQQTQDAGNNISELGAINSGMVKVSDIGIFPTKDNPF